jgi:hypothetical protein
MAADHRSIHPALPGLPWWAAVVVAVATTTAGVAFDAGSGNKELTHSFAAMYVLGCVAAALAVRQSGVFTAVIQPPLILFCMVPGAYWLFHGASVTEIKTIVINCGYPLIERFPLMLFTSAGVLLIGMCRWYFATASSSQPRAGAEAADSAARTPSAAEKLGTKFAAMLNRRPAHVNGAAAPHRRRAGDRAGRSTARPRNSGSARRFASTSSRHVRPQFDDMPDAPGRPRRQRPTSTRHEEPPLRRRRRSPQDSTRRGQPTRKARHSQSAQDGRRRQPAREAGRDPHPRTGRPRPRMDFDQPVAPEPPPRRRHATKPTNGSGGTHHPISQVRYRSQNPGEEFPRHGGAESWKYDI